MESVVALNQRLIDHFGLDTETGRPLFRIVWADDQTERVLTDRLDSGIQLVHPIMATRRKYPYLRGLHVLERLVIIPEEQQEELGGLKTSYEPIWTFATDSGAPLPPKWEVTEIVIDTLYAALGKKSLAKYTEDTSPEAQEEKIIKLQQELFGNETDTGDALRYKEGVTVPHNYERKVN